MAEPEEEVFVVPALEVEALPLEALEISEPLEDAELVAVAVVWEAITTATAMNSDTASARTVRRMLRICRRRAASRSATAGMGLPGRPGTASAGESGRAMFHLDLDSTCGMSRGSGRGVSQTLDADKGAV
jgi:hypothetical protein